MKRTLQYLFGHNTLTVEQAYDIMLRLGKGEFNEHEITAFTTVFLMRSITINELKGFRKALDELAVKIRFEKEGTIDIVGTGGDGKNTFNISTLSCFIVAGAGIPVTKHGNYGVSAISGASNVMEYFGYRFSNDASELNRQLDKANMCFLHAPLFHPALKIVAPIRKGLSVRTFFNMLGPLVNPGEPYYLMIGVYNREMGRIYSYLLQELQKRFTIVHSLDGYDEVSLTSDVKIIDGEGDHIKTPEAVGKRMVQPADIYGGASVSESAGIFLKILEGKGSWSQNSVVLANAAVALHGFGLFENYEDCYLAAVESLESGRAHQTFKTLMS